MHVGAIPDGLYVLHSCDEPKCVNPAHLRTGTQKNNMEDRKKAGNTARGSKIASAKLNEDVVREIRRLLKEGVLTQQAIADRFGVSDTTISHIRSGARWGHLK